MSDNEVAKINPLTPDRESYHELVNKLLPRERRFWNEYVNGKKLVDAYFEIAPRDPITGKIKTTKESAYRSASRMLSKIKKSWLCRS